MESVLIVHGQPCVTCDIIMGGCPPPPPPCGDKDHAGILVSLPREHISNGHVTSLYSLYGPYMLKKHFLEM